MAKVIMTLTAEMDLLTDAIRDIERIFIRLATCHGAQYRDLERRIEAMVQDAAYSDPKSHDLGGGRFLFEPPVKFKVIISDARKLGVI